MRLVVALLLFLLLASTAEAACVQSQLAGRWQISGMSDTGRTAACMMTVTNNGRMNGHCTLSYMRPATLAGELKVVNRRSCKIELSVDSLTFGPISGFASDSIIHATGLAFSASGTTVGHFILTKVPH